MDGASLTRPLAAPAAAAKGWIPGVDMRNYQYCIHGVSLSLDTDSPTIANTVQTFLRYFQQPTLRAAPHLEIVLREVQDAGQIPIEVSPASMLLSSPYEESMDELSHTEWTCDLYRDGDGKIADLHDHGCLRLDDRRGRLEGYLINPSQLHPAIQIAIFHFALTELLKRHGLYTIHATALEKDGYGFLIPGRSGQGKTTCCIALLRSGYRFLADDHPFVCETDNQLELLSFPEKIDVTDATIAFFPELQQANGHLHQGLIKRYFYADDLYPGAKIDRCNPAFIILPQVIEGPQSYLEPLPKRQVLEELLPQGLLVFDKEIAQLQFRTLTHLVEQAACYRLYSGENVRELPRIVDTLLEQA